MAQRYISDQMSSMLGEVYKKLWLNLNLPSVGLGYKARFRRRSWVKFLKFTESFPVTSRRIKFRTFIEFHEAERTFNY